MYNAYNNDNNTVITHSRPRFSLGWKLRAARDAVCSIMGVVPPRRNEFGKYVTRIYTHIMLLNTLANRSA